MKRAHVILAAAIAVVASLEAHAATADGTGLYARAEAGFSRARDANFRDDDPTSADCFLISATPPPRCAGDLDRMGRGGVFGIGLGYRLPRGFRADVSYNRRQGYNLRGSDTAGTDFDPPVKSDTIMVNGTFDLPVMLGPVKPFIGAGIGRTRNDMKPIKWNDPTCCSGTLTGGTRNDRAWQLTLGGEVDLFGWTFEFLYRYTDLGKFVKEAGRDQSLGPFNASGNTGSATGKLRTNEFVVAVRRPI